MVADALEGDSELSHMATGDLPARQAKGYGRVFCISIGWRFYFSERFRCHHSPVLLGQGSFLFLFSGNGLRKKVLFAKVG